MSIYRPLVVALGRFLRIGTSDVLDLSNPVNAQTGTTYTLALSDGSSPVTCTNASAITVTVPPNGSVALPIGTEIEVMQGGAGQVTFAPGIAVTLNSASGNLSISAQGGKVKLRKTGTNTWYLSGDLTVTSNVIARQQTQLDIVSNNAKTAAFSFSVAGNKLGTSKTIHIVLFGDYLNNSATTRVLTLELAFGATVMWADASTATTASGTRHAWRWEIWLTAQNATNVQVVGGTFQMSNITGATTGTGDLSVSLPTNATVMNTSFFGTAAEDSTAAKTFAANITHAASDANLSFRVQSAIAYLEGEGQKGDTGPQGAQGTAGVGTGTMPPSANSPQTTNYTAQLADAASFVDMNSGSALTFTIPPHSSVAFANGTVLAFVQLGAGAVTATAGAGVTIKPAAVVSSRQDGWVFLVQKSQDVWGATGDFA